jgi:hypothetical protein
MSHKAQLEQESILSQPYAAIGTSVASIPTGTSTSNPWDVTNYVHSTANPPTYSYDYQNTATTEPFVTPTTDTTCTCTLAASSSWNDGRYSGTVYRFITFVADPCPACANSKDYKRVSVVVSVPGHAPFIQSTIKRNPA